ncbi:MAG: hypothetical protein JXA54_16650 [Candidatus Heimdallarchaeota archaeon]|nr:hypothetical protein [Candidatus Heimdallarchaeota archaeon]
MVLQSDSHELRRQINLLEKTDTGVYLFYWAFPIKFPSKKSFDDKVLFFDRQYSEWIELKPVKFYPNKDFFKDNEFFPMGDDPSICFNVLGDFYVIIRKIDNAYYLQLKREK